MNTFRFLTRVDENGGAIADGWRVGGRCSERQSRIASEYVSAEEDDALKRQIDGELVGLRASQSVKDVAFGRRAADGDVGDRFVARLTAGAPELLKVVGEEEERAFCVQERVGLLCFVSKQQRSFLHHFSPLPPLNKLHSPTHRPSTNTLSSAH